MRSLDKNWFHNKLDGVVDVTRPLHVLTACPVSARGIGGRDYSGRACVQNLCASGPHSVAPCSGQAINDTIQTGGPQ